MWDVVPAAVSWELLPWAPCVGAHDAWAVCMARIRRVVGKAPLAFAGVLRVPHRCSLDFLPAGALVASPRISKIMI